MNYFVTINGEIISKNLTKKKAIKEAIKKAKSFKDFNVGIGKTKWNQKQGRCYCLLPLHFYID